MYPLCQLSDADLAWCKMLAGLRRYMNRERGAENQMHMESTASNHNEELGIIAEYAFCKHHNIYFDGTFAGKDAGYDCKLRQKKVDVKAIDNPNHNLVAYIKKENVKIDIYALVLIENNAAFIAGWAWRDELVREENIRDLGYGPRYFLHREKLHPWGQKHENEGNCNGR